MTESTTLRAASMPPSVRSFHDAVTGTWTHVVRDPSSHHVAVIDPLLDFDAAAGRVAATHIAEVVDYLDRDDLRLDWILETHAHADHLSAARWLQKRAGGRIGIGAGIVEVQRRFVHLLDHGADFGADGRPFDHCFADGETFAIGALEVRVLATPGHTPDGVSYLIGDAVFVGDTLFAPQAGTGRCDFPGGDATTQYRSIRKLYALPDPTRVFLCHDYPAAGSAALAVTSIGEQKAHNIQLRDDTSEAEYVAARQARDATLPAPKLLWPSLQVNIRAGALPPADEDGRIYLRIPLQLDFAPDAI